MDNRPEFWDFFRAMRGSKNEDWYLKVAGKETGKITVYYKTHEIRSSFVNRIRFLLSLILLIVIFFTSINNLWLNLQIDLNLINFGLVYLISIFIFRRIYERTEFEEAPEEEWSESCQSRRKPHGIFRILGKFIFTILILFVFLSTYSYTYFRYLVEDGASKASAEVSFHTSADTEVLLDMSTPEGAVFDGQLSDDHAVMKVFLKKIPVEAVLYINGTQTEMDSIRLSFHFFWEDEYFESSAYVLADLNKPGEVNTLEIKAGGFDKVWTFTIKQDT